jgi:transposase
LNGNHILLELPLCNSLTFQLFLDELSRQNPNELKLLVLDNGAFHKAKALNIPDNVILIFLPPYSPELNPVEKIWAKFKRDFTNKLFNTIEDLSVYVCHLAINLTNDVVIKISAYDYIFFDPFWTIL